MKITGLRTFDVRFPTSSGRHGSDAMHADPDYSAAYVILETDTGHEGHGHTFTIGRGNELCVAAIEALGRHVIGRRFDAVSGSMRELWQALVGDSQLRWLGPDKGVVHLATAAIVNAAWDLWARALGKPGWKLLADLEPEELLGALDLRHLGDALTRERALELLERGRAGAAQREREMRERGYPGYTTSAGWLGYGAHEVRDAVETARAQGFRHFKIKVGQDLDADRRRCGFVRELIGADGVLMVDANQVWDVPEAIRWMRELAEFEPLWIEEPTHPDDVLGHRAIRAGLADLGIGVATGEHCANRILFKQYLAADAIDFVQIDTCRLGGISECLVVALLAAHFDKPLCPHGGGVGLSECAQHVSVFDYVGLSGSLDGRLIEFAGQLHEHFVDPARITRGRYRLPERPGFATELTAEARERHAFPDGAAWR